MTSPPSSPERPQPLSPMHLPLGLPHPSEEEEKEEEEDKSCSSSTGIRHSKSTPQLSARSKATSITPRVIVTRTDIPVTEYGSLTGSGIMRATTMSRLSSYDDLQAFGEFLDDEYDSSGSSGSSDSSGCFGDNDGGGNESDRCIREKAGREEKDDGSDVGRASDVGEQRGASVALVEGMHEETVAQKRQSQPTPTAELNTVNSTPVPASGSIIVPLENEHETDSLDQAYYSGDWIRPAANRPPPPLPPSTVSRDGVPIVDDDNKDRPVKKLLTKSQRRRRSVSNRHGHARERKSSLNHHGTEIENREIGTGETLFETPPTVRQASIQLVKSINTKFHFEVTKKHHDLEERGSSGHAMRSKNGSGISKKTARSQMSNVELKWEDPPKNILIMKHPNASDINKDVANMIRYLTEERCCHVYMEPLTSRKMLKFDHSLVIETYSDEEKQCLHNIIDLVIVCGGDGTLLHTAHQFPTAVPPILSFHTGSLGVLTSFARLPEFRHTLDKIFSAKKIFITIRMRLSCRIIRKENSTNAQDSSASLRPPEFTRLQSLNEVVVDRGVSPFLTSLDMYCNDKMVTTVAADGLIVASPTGSTAYSMSAGGSMVHSDVPCILVTPVCPHSLSFRPIILPDTVVLKIKVGEKSRGTAWVSVDGKFRQELMKGDAIEITTSVWPMPLICSEEPTSDWFQTLSTMFHWNTREVHQKELPQEESDNEDWSYSNQDEGEEE